MMPQKICYVTSEVAPLIKTGGLADVSAALPKMLALLGHDVRVIVPLYATMNLGGVAPEAVPGLQQLAMTLGPHVYHYSVYRLPKDTGEASEPAGAGSGPGPAGTRSGPGPTVFLIHCPALYNRQAVYTNDGDEALRFALLSRAALETCQRTQWSPDVVHCHDWQTALIPLYLKTVYGWDRLFEKTRTLLTIHNIGYQGVFSSQILSDLGLADQGRLLYQEDLQAGVINFMKTGILYASMLSTVSPTYAREIQTEGYGFGLHQILSARWESLVGILNGVDYHEWDPATDPLIVTNYTKKTLPLKERNKEALLKSMGLPYTAGAPVFGIVSRLASQKGFELIGEALPGILNRHDCRLVVLGSGEHQYEEMFEWLQRTFPGQVAFYRGYNESLAHRIEAGSDMFLMPSRYEPCGLNQMYSLRYGTVPIVRNTGGLADTVRLYEPISGEGTGFVFDHMNADGLRWAIEFALTIWPDRKAWRKLQKQGMSCDYSWEHQGRLYVELYRRMSGR